MSTTTTTNLGLTKAVKGTAEPFSIDSINGNLDILDEAVGDLQESASLFERSYTVNGVTFEFRKFGRVVVVTSSGTPTNAVTTTGYAGNTTLDAAFKPADTFIAHITALAGVTMQINIGQTDGNFTYGIASSTIGTSSNIRCCFSYITAA